MLMWKRRTKFVSVANNDTWRCFTTEFPIQEGQTALYKASYYGHNAVVHTLVNAKAKVNVQNKVRKTYICGIPYST